MQNVDVDISHNKLIISISGKATARTFDLILERMNSMLLHRPNAFSEMTFVLDLSRVKVILPGCATGIVCLCSFIMNSGFGKIDTPMFIEVYKPNEEVLSYLMTIGFFTVLSAKAKLMGYSDLVLKEEELKNNRKSKRNNPIFKGKSYNDDNPVVWPMKIIGGRDTQRSYKKFEDNSINLVNDAALYFDELFSSPHFNFHDSDIHDFHLAIYESYMNIYEHSNSWGLTMIHARPKYGTYISCYDIGIGIRKSLSNSPHVKENLENDSQAIIWALQKGHSSKNDGNGLGLSTIEEFVSNRDGIFEIRSGKSLFRKSPNTNNKWKKYTVPDFVGTQLNIFVPSKSR